MLNLLATIRNKDKKPYDNKIEWVMDGLIVVPYISNNIEKTS